MLSKKDLSILLSLVFVGLIVALKLFHIDYMINYSEESYQSFCNINKTFNCDAVAASPYSYFFGIPVALLGAMGNLFLLILYPLFLRKREELKRNAKGIYLLVFGAYVVGCLSLMVISFTKINSFCILCMAYWLLAFITFGFLLFISRHELKIADFFKKLFQDLWKNKFFFIFFMALYIGLNFGITHLLLQKHCSNPSLQSCQHYDKTSNLSFLGEGSGELTVTVFTDFECPYCRKINGYVERLAEKYKNKIRLVRKEFPLDQACNPLVTRPFHENACLAAYYAKCAGLQGKFWEYHNQLYKTTQMFNEDLFKNIAEDLRLNMRKIDVCIKSPEIHNAVKSEIDEGIKLKIEGTPTFKIFGEVLPGIISENDIRHHLEIYPYIEKEVIDRALEQGLTQTLKIYDIRNKSAWDKWHFKTAIYLSSEELKQKILTNESGLLDFHGDILICGDSSDDEILNTLFQLMREKGMNTRILKL